MGGPSLKPDEFNPSVHGADGARCSDSFPARVPLESPTEQARAAEELRRALGMQGFVGSSQVLLRELQKIPRFAPSEACVLIQGETGTGKELCARALHHLGPRSSRPFVALNTGAMPTELVENELFGHEPGAYTHAQTVHRGVIAEAEGGTLFLDEIDALPLAAQVKLLRFLQEKEYRPLGARSSVAANVRVVAASNMELEREVQAGRFRRDLYYRINVLPLRLPALSQRREDIRLLAAHFLARHCRATGAPVRSFSGRALEKLEAYAWPGNVRELENVVERAVVLGRAAVIEAAEIDLPSTFDETAEALSSPPREAPHETFRAAKSRVVRDFELTYLQRLLRRHDGNISRAARDAGKNRRAFFALMQKYRIRVRVLTASVPANQIELEIGGEHDGAVGG